MNEQQIFQMLLQRAMSDPRFANNPQAQEIIQVLQSGDAQRGAQLAQNYCQSFGVDPMQIAQQAQQYASQMFRPG